MGRYKYFVDEIYEIDYRDNMTIYIIKDSNDSDSLSEFFDIETIKDYHLLHPRVHYSRYYWKCYDKLKNRYSGIINTDNNAAVIFERNTGPILDEKERIILLKRMKYYFNNNHQMRP